MAKFCGNCGSALNGTAAFCGGCGARVPASAPATSAPAAAPSVLASYAPVATNFSPVAAAPAPQQAPFAPIPQPPTLPLAAAVPVPPSSAVYAPVQGNFAAASPAAAHAQAYSAVQAAPAQVSYSPAPASYPPATPGYASGTPYPVAVTKKSNTLLKVIVAFVVIIFVGGAVTLGALWYAAQKIKEKAHAVAAQALQGTPVASSGLGQMLSGVASLKGGDDAGFHGDPCRFLSKEEVSQAVGIQVIRADASDDGCSYIAHGDPADVTSKHMSSMVGGLSGADPKTQKQIQKIAGAFFAQQEASDKALSAEAKTGEVPVLGIQYTVGNAEAEMKMNRGAFTHVTGGVGTASTSGSGDLDGIGDEAYVAGGSMLIFRKGNTAAHFTYYGCPCNTDNIKPLAKLVASRL